MELEVIYDDMDKKQFSKDPDEVRTTHVVKFV